MKISLSLTVDLENSFLREVCKPWGDGVLSLLISAFSHKAEKWQSGRVLNGS